MSDCTVGYVQGALIIANSVSGEVTGET